MLAEITPIVLTYNEAPNIARTLEKLRWAREVLVVDSVSGDETIDIVRGFANARMVTRAFDHHADQWNFALDDPGIATEWVMALDADYVLSEALIAEIAALAPDAATAGFEAGFRYVIDGKPLRGTLYPPLPILFRRARGRYERHGHRMLLRLDGPTQRLHGTIDHDDRKPFDRWIGSQRRYAQFEAQRLRATRWSELRKRDWLRLAIPFAPALVPVYCLFVLGLWRDGRAGWQYVRERTIAEVLIAKELVWPTR